MPTLQTHPQTPPAQPGQPATTAMRAWAGRGMPGAPQGWQQAVVLAKLAGLLALLGVALWPSLYWVAMRMRDGSDNPLGLVALLSLLGLALWHAGASLRLPRTAWLCTAAILVVATALSQARLPALLTAMFALLSLAALWLAVRPGRLAAAPILGLAILSLPILASLQFYVGYPLRVLVAEATRWLLQPFFDVTRSGAALQVDGQWILVDAACSGIQMAWWGYFVACIAALLLQAPNRQFLPRLPLVGLTVLLGNIARNAILVVLQSDGQVVGAWLHEGVGLALLAVVCAMVWRHMARDGRPSPSGRHALAPPLLAGPQQAAFTPTTITALVIAAAALWQLGPGSATAAAAHASASASAQPYVEAPTHWQGQRLRPIALSSVEQRFAADFPGRIERLTTDDATLIWRHVHQPTRMLHPAADCFRGAGYRVHGEQLRQQPDGTTWRCFIAERGGERMRVCEHITGADSSGFSDTSAWYWAALLGSSSGPWQALTVVTAW